MIDDFTGEPIGACLRSGPRWVGEWLSGLTIVVSRDVGTDRLDETNSAQMYLVEAVSSASDTGWLAPAWPIYRLWALTSLMRRMRKSAG